MVLFIDVKRLIGLNEGLRRLRMQAVRRGDPNGAADIQVINHRDIVLVAFFNYYGVVS